MDHAADDALGRHGARQLAAGIERLQARCPRLFRPWKNHQGTPFIAVTTEVSLPSSGAMRVGDAL